MCEYSHSRVLIKTRADSQVKMILRVHLACIVQDMYKYSTWQWHIQYTFTVIKLCYACTLYTCMHVWSNRHWMLPDTCSNTATTIDRYVHVSLTVLPVYLYRTILLWFTFSVLTNNHMYMYKCLKILLDLGCIINCK